MNAIKDKWYHYFFIITLIICFRSVVYSQSIVPENSFLYSDKEVARIDISIHPDSLTQILVGNFSSDHEYPANFKMTRGTEVKSVDHVGFRLRGNTSRFSQKKSFKVSINSFTPGKKFEGVEKINLNGEHNDPSVSRAKLCWDLFRDMGVPSPRACHVELYINGEYRGLYLNVEHVDENFAKSRFDNNDGNLYKCLWPADLNYIGSDTELYKYGQGGRRAYELKRNEEADDYSDLYNLIDILNNSDNSELPVKLEPVFNVNSYLKNLVIEVMTGHWDAYSYNKNNYYLYHNELTDKFEFIPYDTDNTFGIDWFGIDWAQRDIYNWSHQTESRPLYEKLLENELYRNRFSFYMNRFISNYFSSEKIDPQLNTLRDLIDPFTISDIYRTMDYGYNYDDFYNSFDIATGEHVKYGIKPYVETRSQSAQAQLTLVNISPIISNVLSNHSPSGDEITITALIEDEEVATETVLHYNTGEGYKSIQMNISGEEFYKIVIPGYPASGILNYYITASDILSQTTREPIEGEYTFSVPTNIPSYFAGFERVKVFPNPFSTELNLSFSGDYYSIDYSITNISGKALMAGRTMHSETRITIENEKFSPGIYFFRLEGKNIQGRIIATEYMKLIYNE